MQASLVQVNGVGAALASHFSWRDIHPIDCLGCFPMHPSRVAAIPLACYRTDSSPSLRDHVLGVLAVMIPGAHGSGAELGAQVERDQQPATPRYVNFAD